jgi:Tol biopolymer transport system component
VFSPDGTTIAFTSEVGDTDTVRTVVPGGGIENVTSGEEPSYSSDGSKIVFVRIQG